MWTEETRTQNDQELAFEPTSQPLPRRLDCSPEAVRSALRRVVHDYIAGWGIVLTQSPKERRRKKRLWNRRTSERHAFRRPVWVRSANWVEAAEGAERTLVIRPPSDMFMVNDLSDTGIGLASDSRPRSRLVVLEFDSWKGKPVELVVYLRWRSKVDSHDYRTGGSLLGVLVND